MSDLRDQWFQVLLDELRKSNDKLDDVRKDTVENTAAVQSIEKIVDKQSDRLDKYNEQLEIHIKGVEILDKRQTSLEKKVHPIVEEYAADKVIKAHTRKRMVKIAKILGIISTIVGIVATIYKLN